MLKEVSPLIFSAPYPLCFKWFTESETFRKSTDSLRAVGNIHRSMADMIYSHKKRHAKPTKLQRYSPTRVQGSIRTPKSIHDSSQPNACPSKKRPYASFHRFPLISKSFQPFQSFFQSGSWYLYPFPLVTLSTDSLTIG